MDLSDSGSSDNNQGDASSTDSSDGSNFIKGLLTEGNKQKSDLRVYTREAMEEKSKLKIRKREDPPKANEKKTQNSENTPKLRKNSSKGILKNGNQRGNDYSFKIEDYEDNIDTIEAIEKVKPPTLSTNLDIKTWSVCSYDSCSGDVRRTYNKHFSNKIGRLFGGVKSLAVFKNKDDNIFPIPMHEDSDYEDDEPFGPHDPESNFYKKKKQGSKGRRKTMKRLTSFASFSSKKSTNDKRSSGKSKSFKSRVARASKNPSADDSDDEQKNKANNAPVYVPPDMTWDPSFNNGKGGLVNKEQKFLPANKVWSKSANNGRGGVINRPPHPHTIAPGLIWSRSACNGQGGLVNAKPDYIPHGMMWDYNADDGMGALVDASESYLARQQKEKDEKKRLAREKRALRKKKSKSSGRKIKLDSEANELLRQVQEENDRIMAEIEAQEKLSQENERKLSKQRYYSTTSKNVPNHLNNYIPGDDDDSVVLINDDRKASKSSSMKYERARAKHDQEERERRKSLKIKKTLLRAATEKSVNKENAQTLGIEEGHVVKMFEAFEAMSLGTNDAIKDFDSDASSSSSSSGSELI